MCGILACFSKKMISKHDFTDALFKMQHRGPDDYGLWYSEKDSVWLGHVRLSTIGLANGKQPLIDADNKIIAIVNGEFYDYKSIRSELVAKGYIFKTDTDSEILIPLYLEYN